jgi:hypothetical protein
VKIRTIVAYKDYFEEFLVKQPVKVQNKIYKIFEIIEYQQHIPTRIIEHIKGTEGLYEPNSHWVLTFGEFSVSLMKVG